MIVLDSSAVIYLLLEMPPHSEAIRRRVGEEEGLAAPHLLDVEVAQVLRRFVRAGEVSAATAREALAHLARLPIARHPHTLLLPRAFELRENATAYDAVFLALAEILGAPLLTRDAGLARVPGCTARVDVVR